MTVSELLKRMLAVYPGFDGKAGEALAPVFRARLQKHEGDALEKAAGEVFASFKATTREPFPKPVDFENFLPSGKLNLPGNESPLRQMMEERRKRAANLFSDWHAGQGAKIKAARSFPVYAACLNMAHQRAGMADAKTQRIILSAEQIAECEQRALSSERNHRFYRLPATNEEWQRQIEEISASWRTQAEAA